MRGIKILQVLTLTVLLGGFAAATSSCSDDDDNKGVGSGTVTGTVTDYDGNALDGVTVTIDDVTTTATTSTNGSFTIANVPMDSRTITFSKTSYQTSTATLSADRYVNGVATVNVSLDYANATIEGIVYDAKNDDAPLSGVNVALGTTTAQTGSDGKFKFENLSLEEQDLVFTKADYETITRTVYPSDFVDGYAYVEVTMGSDELLPGKTIFELGNADKWYYNEYRGGRNADAYPHWDWSVDYMAALDFYGRWEEQNEGTTLQVTNENARADLNNFDSYVYGSKLITDDNKIMSVRLRTHSTTVSTYFGVQVVDLTEQNPKAVKIGDVQNYSGEGYVDYEFDLSAYVGKEVVIAVGIYNNGEYAQFVLRSLRFASRKVEGTNWLPGNEIISGWQLTDEIIRSTMPHTKTLFTGISPISGNRDNYAEAYQSWRGVNHVAMEWSLMPVQKDPEVFPGEGYLIKTTGSGFDLNEPKAYIYAKFSIAEGSNKLTLWTRTFGPNNTYFKFTAFSMDGTYKHILPTGATVGSAESGGSGCWVFNHDSGSAGDLDAYTTFTYDLSEFNGQDILVAFSVYKGGTDGDENKLLFRQIEIK